MKTKPTNLERLKHIANSIEKIFSYTNDLNLQTFLENEMIQDAVMKNFEVIGEAAYHITSELKNNYQNIEWRKIQGLRHILVHDYYQINPIILWNTRNKHLHKLLVDIEEIIDIERES